MNARGDLVNKQLYFDEQDITLYDQEHNVYGTMAAPPAIEGALEKANKEFGLRVALTDLASPNLCELLTQRIKHALYVGLHKVHGVNRHHLSFDGRAAQLQVWVDAGDQPVPRKIVLTHKQLPGSPQWTAYLSDWNFAPQLADDLFVFTPPEGAEKIEFLPVKAARAQPGGPQKKPGRTRSNEAVKAEICRGKPDRGGVVVGRPDLFWLRGPGPGRRRFHQAAVPWGAAA